MRRETAQRAGLAQRRRGNARAPSSEREISVAGRLGLIQGAINIARKPNYDFERRERERSKAAEAAKKAQAKADKRAAGQDAPDADPSADS